MITQKYKITGMTCAACSSAVERVTRKMDGVVESNVNLTTGILVITYDETLLDPEKISVKLTEQDSEQNFLLRKIKRCNRKMTKVWRKI